MNLSERTASNASRISIATDFTKYPGGRYRHQGRWSGEEFREDILKPALEKGEVVVDLSGTYGYPSSFLEEAFGGLVRQGLGERIIRDRLRFETSDTSFNAYVDQAWRFIHDACARD